jgi:long-subunit acyl-CoA synthetase (AMP-forming)
MGRNISPEWVEAELLADGTLRQAVVFGDGRPWCTALLYPAADTDDDALTRHVAAVNAGLPEYARIRAWHRLAEPLSSRAGLLSGNGRLRRAAIEEDFSAAIDGVYRQYQESSR